MSKRLEEEGEKGETLGLALWVGLGETRDPIQLRETIFGTEKFERWRRDDGLTLHLFLDSLDEARLKIERVADLLISGFEGVDFSRLVLRLSCRSADRQIELEQTLRQRFGEEHFAIRELAPLSRNDVLRLAEDRGFDAERTIREISERELQPLAMIPVSLGFLLDALGESGELPRDRAAIYDHGLRQLAREPDEERRAAELTGDRMTPGARLAIAARIASALILSGRTTVRTDERPPSVDQASLANLSGGTEQDTTTAVECEVEVGVGEIEKVLKTSLFTAHGDNGLGFGQATYAEYLCARWLAGGALSERQLESILFVEVGERTRVVPQLREVAAWLARFSASFRERMLGTDPKVLLRADPASLTESEREVLVDALLGGVRGMEIERWDRRMRSNYTALRHPSLLPQLRSVILEVEEEPFVRQVACDVAGACELDELAPELIEIALDNDCDLQVRDAALSAAGKLGGPEQLDRLRPLALEEVEVDEDDELKGHALSILWPDHLSAEELFSTLRPPRRRDLLGAYKGFLWRLDEVLRPEDLPAALEWAREAPAEYVPIEALPELREKILILAWPRLRERPELVEPFGAAIVPLLRNHFNLSSNEGRRNDPGFLKGDATRRKVVECLVERIIAEELRAVDLLTGHGGLIAPTDAEWLISWLEAEIGTEREPVLVELTRALLMMGVGDEEVYRARESSQLLREMTVSRYEAVALDSAEAREARAYQAKMQRWDREEREEQEEIDVAQGLAKAIAMLERGEQRGFWIAGRWLEVDPEKRRNAHFVSDLRALAGWESLAPETQERFDVWSRDYLRETGPEPERWFGKSTIYFPAVAGYRAMRWLYEGDRDALEGLGAELWARWAPIVVGWHRDFGSNEAEFNDWALEQLSRRAPGEASRWLIRKLDRELTTVTRPSALQRLDQVWNPEIEAAMMRRARRSGRDPVKRTELLRALIARGSDEALRHAQALIAPVALRSESRRALAVEVAALLFRERPDGNWAEIARLLYADDDFGRSWIAAVARRESGLPPNLSELDAVDLYIWVLGLYPAEEDPDIEGAHSVGPREEIGHWRNGVLNWIAQRGTPDAVKALGVLLRKRPELIYVRRLMRDAEEAVERSEWSPPLPAEVVRLSAEHTARYVRSARDLRRVTIDSLERAQQKLGGINPQAYDVWDAKILRPKPEPLVSHWLANHFRADLEERGVIVGRELEIRPHPGGRKGEAVDIVLSVSEKTGVAARPELNVMVEVKCCWNREIDTAMEDQLHQRYLDAESDQGIYVVAQFEATNWADCDRANREACRKRTLSESRDFFAAQATEISSGGLADISSFVLDCSLNA